MNTRKKTIIEYTVYTSIIVFGVILDQLTKWLAVKFLDPISTFPIIKDVFHFTFLKNRGAAFGMLSDRRWVFMTVSTVAILALAIFLYMRKSPNIWYAISISAIVSGGIGNMIDRIALGYVVDFIDVRLIDFAIFNIADCFVTVGAIGLITLLVIDMIADIKKARDKKAGK
ncbi:MAG: signal peptidase II [Clostridia bacterium]|nr:signal peptidase II [Clostridia bacterium]